MATRSEFSKVTKRQALKRSGFKCEAVGVMYGLEKGKRCNGELGTGIEYDHIVRAADGGDNSLENCATVCKTCHSIKTRQFDVPQAAKTKRMSDKRNGISRPKGQIKSAPFHSGNKRKQHPVDMPARRSLFASRDR